MPSYDVAALKKFFFKAALATYVSGKKGERDSINRWEHGFRYESPYKEDEDPKYIYIDRYVVNGEYSGGSTVILVDGVPAWLMQYHGECNGDDPKILDFLRTTLKFAYEKGEFCGGRGPYRFKASDGEFEYENTSRVLEGWSDFSSFGGREKIWQRRKGNVFWHLYQGFLLGDPA
jgi:hypothetical protein